MPHNQSKLHTATQAEILRSHQRDTDFVTQISDNATDILHRYGLYRTFSKFAKSEVPARLFYFLATSGIGNQTLGEEYTGIVQANLKKQKIPSLLTRTLAAILECFGEQMFYKILENLLKAINKPDSELTPRAKLFLNTFLSRLKSAIPVIILAHRGLFYMFGRYYSISRRLTGVDYVKVYGPRPQGSVGWGLKVLGFATMIQCVLRLWQSRNDSIDNILIDKELDCISTNRCQLCLEKTPNTTTPCGHLFCWNCLAEWLRARNRCPLCREVMAPSRIVPLMNL